MLRNEKNEGIITVMSQQKKQTITVLHVYIQKNSFTSCFSYNFIFFFNHELPITFHRIECLYLEDYSSLYHDLFIY